MLPWLLIPIEGLRKPRSGGLGESNHMKAIFVRESREMEDGLVILGLEKGQYGVSKGFVTAYWGFLGAQIRRIFLEGYGVLVVRTVIFKMSLFKLQNACLFANLHQVEFQRISLTGFRSYTSRSQSQSISKQTTQSSTLPDDYVPNLQVNCVE
ncbi:hypothetical protein Tco_0854048 [Tanacetum coccineum]